MKFCIVPVRLDVTLDYFTILPSIAFPRFYHTNHLPFGQFRFYLLPRIGRINGQIGGNVQHSYPVLSTRRGQGRRLPPTPSKPSTLQIKPSNINFPKLNASPTHVSRPIHFVCSNYDPKQTTLIDIRKFCAISSSTHKRIIRRRIACTR